MLIITIPIVWCTIHFLSSLIESISQTGSLGHLLPHAPPTRDLDWAIVTSEPSKFVLVMIIVYDTRSTLLIC